MTSTIKPKYPDWLGKKYVCLALLCNFFDKQFGFPQKKYKTDAQQQKQRHA